jgi:hypothetical protein
VNIKAMKNFSSFFVEFSEFSTQKIPIEPLLESQLPENQPRFVAIDFVFLRIRLKVPKSQIFLFLISTKFQYFEDSATQTRKEAKTFLICLA